MPIGTVFANPVTHTGKLLMMCITEKAMNRKYVAKILTIKLEESFFNFFNDTFISEVIYLVTNMHANVEFPLTVK